MPSHSSSRHRRAVRVSWIPSGPLALFCPGCVAKTDRSARGMVPRECAWLPQAHWAPRAGQRDALESQPRLQAQQPSSLSATLQSPHSSRGLAARTSAAVGKARTAAFDLIKAGGTLRTGAPQQGPSGLPGAHTNLLGPRRQGHEAWGAGSSWRQSPGCLGLGWLRALHWASLPLAQKVLDQDAVWQTPCCSCPALRERADGE